MPIFASFGCDALRGPSAECCTGFCSAPKACAARSKCSSVTCRSCFIATGRELPIQAQTT
ncbi:MAG: hypothetical protein MI923_07040 [Phycisphaerales bacterium]|nr:hypothetical protein [Phycisphaerales bacterium]